MHLKTPTENDIITGGLTIQPPDIKLIKKLIDEHDTISMRTGVRYYENENDIIKREQHTVQNGVKVKDDDKPNNRIPHGWHKLLVDQKASYMVGNPINFSVEDDDELLKHINDSLGEKFDDIANELVKNASNKGKEWLHPFIDEEGNFDYIITPAEQIIPIYEDKKQTKIKHIIRYYPIVLGEEQVIQVELWDAQTVTYYIIEDSKLYLDVSEPVNPASHFTYASNEGEAGYGWGAVPFIPFKNNEQEKGDLHYYKQLIDAYDNKFSDNQNSFDEIQELIYILKGYEGEGMSEFMQNLKYYKAVGVSEGGGVDTLQAEIPMTSIDSHLDRTRESIYMFGGGVDTAADKLGNAPSGISLKFLYSLLDMKSDTLERKFRTALQELMWFLCEYLEMSGDGHEKHDYKAVDYTFKRSTMSNDLENADIAQKSIGIISTETIVANHPWVDNLEVELERIAKEQESRMPLDDGGEDDDDEGIEEE